MAKNPKAGSGTSYPDDLYQLLLFPERAEYLDQARFRQYKIHLEHWRELSTEFRQAFEEVYVRKSARILLVHGDQGTGKTLFTGRVQDDFKLVRERRVDDAAQNLWVVLTGGDAGDRGVSEQAARTTELRRVSAQFDWLKAERDYARQNTSEMRVFLIDDVQKDAFLREWAGLTAGEYTRFKVEGHVATVLESVAQRLVEDCRGDFQRSLFVLLSFDKTLLDKLHEQLELSHKGLSRLLSLPLPEPALKEEIVRVNTNRLNRWSYWCCLDRGGPKEKEKAYETLVGTGGFIDSFKAIDRAFAALESRPGRPANKNLLTLVTLGPDPFTTRSYIDDHDLYPDEFTQENHVATWLFRHQWASALAKDDGEYARRAELLESEFALRWVTLDMRAVWWLCSAPDDDPTCYKLVRLMRAWPRIGDTQDVKDALQTLARDVDQDLEALGRSDEFRAFEARFRAAGQGRSLEYEQALGRRFGLELSKGLIAFSSVRPDLTLSQYAPCAVTRATSKEREAIKTAIRRTCHVIEFTAYLQSDLRGLDDYLRNKVGVYATLLESV